LSVREDELIDFVFCAYYNVRMSLRKLDEGA
jgi:hypothetical protein